MLMARTIEQDGYYFDGSLDEFIQQIRDFEAKAPVDAEDVRLSIENVINFGDDTASLVLRYKSPETPVERAKRLQFEEDRRDRELALLEQLKMKYETEEVL